MTSLPDVELVDFDGPLGDFEQPLKRRRIAAAIDARGRVALVRPHCIVIDVQDTDHDVDDAVAAIEHDDEVVVMGEPVGGMVGARIDDYTELSGERWHTQHLQEMLARFHDRGFLTTLMIVPA